MNQTLNTRTVQANGAVIKRLRTERGWRVEDLAKKAKCSVRTIKNVEGGASVYVFTLRKLAEVFSVEYLALTTDIISLTTDKSKTCKHRTWEVNIRISTPYEEFDESSDLIRFMSALIDRIGGKDIEQMKPTSVTPGSTEITVEMTAIQLQWFLLHYIHYHQENVERVGAAEAEKTGDAFDELNIVSVKAPYPVSDDAGKYFDGTKREWEKRRSSFRAEGRIKREMEEFEKKQKMRKKGQQPK